MTHIETTQPGRQRAEWHIVDLEQISSVSVGLCEATSDAYRNEHFTDIELDTLLPVDLEVPDAKLAHEIWADLKNTYYQYDTLTTPVEQLISVFAVASNALTPNPLLTEQRAQKNAQCMRAMQSGMQQRYAVLGHDTTARDRSESELSELLYKSKDLLTGTKRTEYNLAIEVAGLQYTPVRRASRVAFRVADMLQSAIRNHSE